MFSYKNNELTKLPFERDLAESEEIRLFYAQGCPYPILEILTYTHKGNGYLSIYWLIGDSLDYITGEHIMGRHTIMWYEERRNAIYGNVDLKEGEYYVCRYENGHLTPSYEDVNKDGYIDIVLSGNFQCENSKYTVLLSQEVKRTFLYDKEQNKFIFNMDTSIRSPLEEQWDPDVTEKIDSLNEENNK